MSIVKVAELAGVSKSTVSRVINQSAQVAPEVVEAVRRAMKEIGYEPPLRRRGPKPASRRGIRTGNVALMVMGYRAADLYRMPVFPSLLVGVERGLAENGLNLILANLGDQAQLPTVLTGNQADGLLLFGKWDDMPQSVRDRLTQSPAVWVMREHSDEEGVFDHVLYNNARVGLLAARHLRRNGHNKHVAFINIHAIHQAFQQRQADFTREMEAAGAKVDVYVGRPSDNQPEIATCQTLVDEMLESQSRPTALFIPTDAHLPGIYHALQVRGVQPMRDIEIISCDNEEQFLSRLSSRPTTIDINLHLVGRRAVQQLLWRMRNPSEKSRLTVLVEPTLVPPSAVPSGT